MGFKIRKIFDDLLPANRVLIEEIIALTRANIADTEEEYYLQMRDLFRHPVHKKMRYIFFAASDLQGRLKGFAQMSHAKDIGFSFLDLIVTDSGNRSGGVGSSLYERVRREAVLLKSSGLFLECIGDEPDNGRDREIIRQNRSRLRFYEKYGALPLLNGEYSRYSRKCYGQTYFLLFDSLDRNETIAPAGMREIVRAVLERKYTPACSKSTIRKITDAVPDEPPFVRMPKYLSSRSETTRQSVPISSDMMIALVFNKKHRIHHVKEKGYAESPVRVENILAELETSGLFREIPAKAYPDSWITAVHSRDFVSFFKKATQQLGPDETIYPDVFPIRKEVTPPKRLLSRAGYYCIDVYSPINRNAWLAARAAVNCSLSAADELLKGTHICYALIRPPGHHADRKSFGGFCYFNNTAIAAHYLSRFGKVAILDLDYHHGNGQEDIFYERADVLTVSIHADPDYEYPWFSGFKADTGYGEGLGYNLNLPLPSGTDGASYEKALAKAVRKIRSFGPHFLLIAFGMDTAKGDPTGSWLLEKQDFRRNGEIIGNLDLPTLVVQEGGYNNAVLGTNALHFFKGLWESQFE